MRSMPFHLPWFILEPNTPLLITSPTIPTTIKDDKEIVWADVNVPGLNYTPLYPSRNGNRKLSFSLPIINREAFFGNVNIMAAFETLRNSDNISINNLFSDIQNQFQSVPEIIYYWGTHTPPLQYFIRNISMEHNTTLTNSLGFSQYTVVNMTLELNEQTPLYRMYQKVRIAEALIGQIQAGINTASPTKKY